MLYGLEKEFFVQVSNADNGLVIPVPEFYSNPDGSGMLVEARGAPHNDITDAVFSLEASCFRLTKLSASKGYYLSDYPVEKITREQIRKVQRKFSKEITKFENLYGYEGHRNKANEHTAGVHISFTNPKTISLGNGGSHTYNMMWDYVSLFKFLDDKFKDEIKNSKRNPGFYELKPDGRIEYRSLPSNVDLKKVISVIESFHKGG